MSEMRTALFFTEDDASRKNRKKKNPVPEMGTEKQREPSVRKESEQKSRPKRESRTERPETKCHAKPREVGTKRGTKIEKATSSRDQRTGNHMA